MTSTAVQKLATEGFGIENLPYGSFELDGKTQLGIRLGDHVIGLETLISKVGGLDEKVAVAAAQPNLDALLAGGKEIWSPLRAWIQQTLNDEAAADDVLNSAISLDKVSMKLAFTPADYVDYYASEHHATNLGKMFRPNEDALKPNWKHLPVGYHGRSGTIFASGTDVIRPKGLRPGQESIPSFGPSNRLDIEAEMGFVLGGAAPRGEVDVAAAADHIFGVFLFNDWSARDIQNYEYVPLGPNLGKSFASTVGEWIVPFEALNGARVAPPERTFELASYLHDPSDEHGEFGLDVTLSVLLNDEVLSNPPFGLMYFTAPQMLAHMTVNGGSLRPGDMFASGTISGPEKDQRGSFIELSWGGKESLQLSDGSEMTFLRDGDTVTLQGTAPGPNGSTINFGNCVGTIKSAT
ncbi:fumarylacetoacetate hydrolase family protein [Corynebacterium crudilactis]|uniref:fumarylacetoacetase n=1 Tax=Corynebacterium crudilactis TaxID=1652495 RepID=A0A172QQ90_9CORY|nr:fumarylacetoacetate hydrolase family protein [Corynebacterium crudilactis]ANE02849.1 fumarylacetoacetase [Corynebacterium crudilactis]